MKKMKKEEKTSIFPKDFEKRVAMVNTFLINVDAYLREIGLDKKLEERKALKGLEIKKLLRKNIEKYFKRKVSQEFVLGLAWKLYELAADIEGSEVSQILGVACPLHDIEVEIMKYGKIRKSPEEIDKLIRQLFEEYLK
jgi:hypothetical protein